MTTYDASFHGSDTSADNSKAFTSFVFLGICSLSSSRNCNTEVSAMIDLSFLLATEGILEKIDSDKSKGIEVRKEKLKDLQDAMDQLSPLMDALKETGDDLVQLSGPGAGSDRVTGVVKELGERWEKLSQRVQEKGKVWLHAYTYPSIPIELEANRCGTLMVRINRIPSSNMRIFLLLTNLLHTYTYIAKIPRLQKVHTLQKNT